MSVTYIRDMVQMNIFPLTWRQKLESDVVWVTPGHFFFLLGSKWVRYAFVCNLGVISQFLITGRLHESHMHKALRYSSVPVMLNKEITRIR